MARTTHGSVSPYVQKQEEEESVLPVYEIEEEEQSEEGDSEAAGKAEDALFTIDGRPVSFCFYTAEDGISQKQVQELVSKIKENGGVICSKQRDADVVLAHEDDLEYLRSIHWRSRTVWVEEPSFVYRCIATQDYLGNLTAPVRKGMGGRAEGHHKVLFTAEDDRNLCKYLAAVCPYKEEGGRFGNVIYQRVCEEANNDPSVSWAKRHPFSSWQNRYKTKQKLLDPIIESIVRAYPPRGDNKGLYERSRLYNKTVLYGQEGEVSDPEDNGAKEAEGNHHHASKGVPIVGNDEEEMERPRPKRPRHTHEGMRRVPSLEMARRAERERPASLPDGRRREASAAFSQTPSRFASPTTTHATPRSSRKLTMNELFGYLPNQDVRPGPAAAGPSGTQHTPSPAPAPAREFVPAAAVSRPQARPKPRTLVNIAAGSQRAEPMSSQATLVGTQARPTQKVTAADDLNRATAGSSQSRTLPARQVETFVEDHDVEIMPRKAKRRKINVMPPPPPVNLDDSRRQRTRQAQSIVASRSQAQVPAEDHPFAVPSPRDKGKGKQRAELEATQEDVESDEVPLEFSDEDLDDVMDEPAFGIVDEENEAVEQMLAVSAQSGQSNGTAQEASPQPEENSDSLDSDDEQMHRSLLQNTQNERPLSVMGPPSSIRASAGSAAPRMSLATPAGPRRLRAQGSEDSDGPVPMPGTRASEEKMKRKEAMRRTPYTPPAGTRAAAETSVLTLRTRRVQR